MTNEKEDEEEEENSCVEATAEVELTYRALLGGIFIGGILCFSNMYFGLQTGWVTMGSLQSALLGYGLFKVIEPPVTLFVPFSAKENVVLQTTAVAAATMPLAAGFVGIIPALELLSSSKHYKGMIIDFTVPQLLLWCLALGFFGVFMAPPLRQQTILREKLPFPSGTATAEIIRQLHGLPSSPSSAKESSDESVTASEISSLLAKANENSRMPLVDPFASKSVSLSSSMSTRTQQQESKPAWTLLFMSFAFSALYTIVGENFVPIIRNVPIFSYLGYPAMTAWSWTIQPSPSYFGQGLIMGPKTALSMLLGTVIGWGYLAPNAQAKGWTSGPINDVATGPTGWLLWISLAIMLADSVVSLSVVTAKLILPKICCISQYAYATGSINNYIRNIDDNNDDDDDEGLDPAPHDQQITWMIWLPGLVSASMLCTVILTPMFSMPSWQVAVAVLFSLLVAVLAIRALGETDLNPVSGIGKVSQLLFAVVAPGNVVANLVAGAVAEAGAMSAGDMMQDLKCGHLLRASPKAQFVGQLVGTGAGCIMVVAAWKLYSTTYTIPSKQFPAPTALIWLDMAQIMNGGGIDLESMNVIPTAMIAAGITAVLPIIEYMFPFLPNRSIIPSAMAAAIGMYVTPNWTLPRVAGGVTNYIWHRWNPESAKKNMIVLASGFVLGEGIASILNAIIKSSGVVKESWVLCWGCPVGEEGFACVGCPSHSK